MPLMRNDLLSLNVNFRIDDHHCRCYNNTKLNARSKSTRGLAQYSVLNRFTYRQPENLSVTPLVSAVLIADRISYLLGGTRRMLTKHAGRSSEESNSEDWMKTGRCYYGKQKGHR